MKRLLWLCALAALLAACAAPPPAAEAVDATVAPSQTPSPTQSATPSPQLAPAEPAAEACLAAGGEMHELELATERLADPMPVYVYTPPCYRLHSQRSYPVLYLIHGQTYTADQWGRLGVAEVADALVAAGELPPFLIVMPQDSRHFAPPEENAFDEVFIEELLPWVEAQFRVDAARENRAVGGLSRGASWAIHLALTHPQLFGAVGGHSPPVFAEEAWRVSGWLGDLAEVAPPRIWLDIGERDQQRILASATWFATLLDEYAIPHQWNLFTGDHSEDYWSRHVELYLRWYATGW
ncbi:MAG: hypothetical protein KIS85_00240 [Anaerolineales bacterium]|nr:hypothetical protein [Anaerolineales bacterium]